MRNLVIVLACALLQFSCSVKEPALTRVCFQARSATKSAADDDLPGRLDLFVFRSDNGDLEARDSCTAGRSIETTVCTGKELSWYLIADAPEGMFTSCSSLDTFLKYTVGLGNGPQMQASGKNCFGEGGGTVNASLSRYRCKVGIGRISVRWTDALPCRVEKAVLVNVQGSSGIDGREAKPPLWYNCGAIDHPGSLDNLLSSSMCAVIEDSLAVDLGITLYCMPNQSERRTGISLCINAFGQDCWYTIEMPPMEGNHYYKIDEIVIKGPGAPGPSLSPERVFLSFAVQITEWEDTETTLYFKESNRNEP